MTVIDDTSQPSVHCAKELVFGSFGPSRATIFLGSKDSDAPRINTTKSRAN
jgi:hypothetical protein